MSGLKYEILYLNSSELNLRLVQVHNVVLITVYVITPNNSMQTLCEVIFSLIQKIIHHSRARKHFVIPPYYLQASGYSLFLLVNAIVVFIVSLLCQMRIGSYSLFHVLANCITIILSDCFLQVSFVQAILLTSRFPAAKCKTVWFRRLQFTTRFGPFSQGFDGPKLCFMESLVLRQSK